MSDVYPKGGPYPDPNPLRTKALTNQLVVTRLAKRIEGWQDPPSWHNRPGVCLGVYDTETGGLRIKWWNDKGEPHTTTFMHELVHLQGEEDGE